MKFADWLITVAVKGIRTIASTLPAFSIIKRTSRKKGISIVMNVKDEEDWIRPSILSIKDFADEIVVVDNRSQDHTKVIISDLKEQEGLNLRLFDYLGNDYGQQLTIGLSATTLTYVVLWAGDIIAKTHGKDNIKKLREILLDDLNESYYYAIRYPIPEVRWDLFHQMSTHWGNVEEYAFTGSNKLKWIQTGKLDRRHTLIARRTGIKTPLYYKRINLNEFFALHCNVKPAKRMLYRKFYTNWLVYYRSIFFCYDEFVKQEIKKRWNTEDIDLATRLEFMEESKQLVPYNKELYGEYPELLRPHLERPRYKIIYQNGKIVGRSPDLL